MISIISRSRYQVTRSRWALPLQEWNLNISMIKITIFALGIALLFPFGGLAQNTNQKFAGKYSDGIGSVSITELRLNEDGTFTLVSIDPVFPNTHTSYQNTGVWTAEDGIVVLNPDKAPREISCVLKEAADGNADSTTIKINYTLIKYENETLKTEEPFDFDQVTIFINDKRTYYTLVKGEIRKVCLFAPKVKNQVIVDSSHTITIPKVGIEKVGIFTYGFTEPRWFEVKNNKSNYLEIEVRHPIDEDRAPRSKKVIVKKSKAYYYEYNGKVSNWGQPLIKEGSEE